MYNMATPVVSVTGYCSGTFNSFVIYSVYKRFLIHLWKVSNPDHTWNTPVSKWFNPEVKVIMGEVEDQGHIVGIASWRFISLLSHANQIICSCDSYFKMWPRNSRVKVLNGFNSKSHTVGYGCFEVWSWKSKVKVTGGQRSQSYMNIVKLNGSWTVADNKISMNQEESLHIPISRGGQNVVSVVLKQKFIFWN